MVSAAYLEGATICRPVRRSDITRSAPPSAFRAGFDDLAILLHEPTDMRIRQQGENGLRRAAELDAFFSHHDGTINQNGICEHLVDQLLVSPFGIVEAEIMIRSASLAQQV